MANKAPAFQFYVGDYMQDTRCLSLAARGAWADCLCLMWRSEKRGEITYPVTGFASLFGCSLEQAVVVLNEIIELGVCNASVTHVTERDKKVTLICRRMEREFKEQLNHQNRQHRYRERKKSESIESESDGKVTLLSSSSSSSSTSEREENHKKHDSLSLSKAAQREPEKPPGEMSREREPVFLFKSKFTLDACKDFALAKAKAGHGIRAPDGFAKAIFKSGDSDAEIQAWIDNGNVIESFNGQSDEEREKKKREYLRDYEAKRNLRVKV